MSPQWSFPNHVCGKKVNTPTWPFYWSLLILLVLSTQLLLILLIQICNRIILAIFPFCHSLCLSDIFLAQSTNVTRFSTDKKTTLVMYTCEKSLSLKIILARYQGDSLITSESWNFVMKKNLFCEQGISKTIIKQVVYK